MKGVYWFEIYVDDMARAKDFYTNVFGCRFTDVVNEISSLSVFDWGENINASCAGALVYYPKRRASSQGVIVYFNVESLSETISLVSKNGGKLIRNPSNISHDEMIALASDVDGNPIGLYTNKIAEAEAGQ